jgi:putative transposase
MPRLSNNKTIILLPLLCRAFDVSMSLKGDCWDNAPIESFWGALKNELVHHRCYKTRKEAIEELSEYIEIFYNRQRKQKQLGYLSPAKYVKSYYPSTVKMG